MRKDSAAMKNIRLMYVGLHLDMNATTAKTKLILSLYRNIVWASFHRARNLYESADEIFGAKLSTALAFLSDFAPIKERQAFEIKVASLFDTKTFVDLIDEAMIRLYDYHSNGKLYHRIISKNYLTAFSYTEIEILEDINLERSTYYDRKKEAVALFGLALWGYSIPKYQELIYKESQECSS